LSYKLIALDIDGTLLDDEHRISPATKRLLRELAEQGIHIVLCTGRGPTSAFPIMRELGISGTIITHNGAAVVEEADGRVLHEYSFALRDVVPLIESTRKNRLHFDISTAFEVFAESLTEEQREVYRKYYLHPRELDWSQFDQPILKCTLYGERAQIDRLEEEWQDFHPLLGLIRSSDHFLDIMHKAATKGNALAWLAERWGIRREEILAIGNYYNDVEMLKFAGLGIAVDNAPEGVKQAADRVTLSNNEEGVYQALKTYLDIP
jgi:hypothetical protein